MGMTIDSLLATTFKVEAPVQTTPLPNFGVDPTRLAVDFYGVGERTLADLLEQPYVTHAISEPGFDYSQPHGNLDTNGGRATPVSHSELLTAPALEAIDAAVTGALTEITRGLELKGPNVCSLGGDTPWDIVAHIRVALNLLALNPSLKIQDVQAATAQIGSALRTLLS